MQQDKKRIEILEEKLEALSNYLKLEIFAEEKDNDWIDVVVIKKRKRLW